MKTKIKINFNNGELDRQKNIVKRKNNRKKQEIIQYIKFLFISIISILIMIGLWNTPLTQTNANEVQNNAEYEYYGVDNYKDYARMLRKEACKRALTEILGEINIEKINHCITTMTLINAYESGFGTSNRCINDNNCMGLKGWTNGSYGFKTFKSQYEGNLYFAEKWFTYHYKKSLHTLIYGYIQTNGQYKYGWSYTDQETYYIFIRSNYNRVLDEIKLLNK